MKTEENYKIKEIMRAKLVKESLNEMTTQEIYSELNGCEVNSLSLEGVVGIINGHVYRNGEEIHPTDPQMRKLWREYVHNELD